MTKTKRILSIVLMAIPILMLIMSAAMKLTGSQQIIEGLSKIGLANYIIPIGIIELICVGLFLFPKTMKLGFLMLCSYLGGAMAIELAGGQFPMAGVFLALIWISVYLRNKSVFIPTTALS